MNYCSGLFALTILRLSVKVTPLVNVIMASSLCRYAPFLSNFFLNLSESLDFDQNGELGFEIHAELIPSWSFQSRPRGASLLLRRRREATTLLMPSIDFRSPLLFHFLSSSSYKGRNGGLDWGLVGRH